MPSSNSSSSALTWPDGWSQTNLKTSWRRLLSLRRPFPMQYIASARTNSKTQNGSSLRLWITRSVSSASHSALARWPRSFVFSMGRLWPSLATPRDASVRAVARLSPSLASELASSGSGAASWGSLDCTRISRIVACSVGLARSASASCGLLRARRSKSACTALKPSASPGRRLMACVQLLFRSKVPRATRQALNQKSMLKTSRQTRVAKPSSSPMASVCWPEATTATIFLKEPAEPATGVRTIIAERTQTSTPCAMRSLRIP
mmetsp:Transcript_31147/g.89287  ORF Transcript_31147/g.89287 Transcript_31147/m.89287 type:complete len:263 (+) Transcript_31147:482-1270(+)